MSFLDRYNKIVKSARAYLYVNFHKRKDIIEYNQVVCSVSDIEQYDVEYILRFADILATQLNYEFFNEEQLILDYEDILRKVTYIGNFQYYYRTYHELQRFIQGEIQNLKFLEYGIIVFYEKHEIGRHPYIAHREITWETFNLPLEEIRTLFYNESMELKKEQEDRNKNGKRSYIMI